MGFLSRLFNPTTPAVWVGSYAAYNEGKLIGEWIQFDDPDELEEGLDDLQKKFPQYEEWGVFDTDNMPGHDGSESVSEAKKWAEGWDEIHDRFGHLDADELKAIMQYMEDTGSDLDSAEEAWSGIEAGGWNPERKLAEELVEQIGGLAATLSEEQIKGYFDYKSFARDLEAGGDITTGRDEDGDFLIAWAGDLSDPDDQEDPGWMTGYTDVEQFAEEFLNDTGISEEHAEIHFDWDAFGRDLQHDYTEYGGYWFRNV